MKVECHVPDAGWQRAADVTLAAWTPEAEAQRYARFIMRPLTAPDGSRVEYLLAIEGVWDESQPRFRYRALVVDDKVINDDGPDAASAYLNRLGFPGRRIERGLLVEILSAYGLLPAGWITRSPSVNGWEVLDDEGNIHHKPVVLVYNADGATLTLFQQSDEDDSNGTDASKLLQKLELRFDRSAKLTRTRTRERRDGTWTPAPL